MQRSNYRVNGSFTFTGGGRRTLTDRNELVPRLGVGGGLARHDI